MLEEQNQILNLRNVKDFYVHMEPPDLTSITPPGPPQSNPANRSCETFFIGFEQSLPGTYG